VRGSNQRFLLCAERMERECQIVSLGTGSNTSGEQRQDWTRFIYLFILALVQAGPLGRHLNAYVELDFPELTTQKTMAVKKSKDLLHKWGLL
jgi:[phosphatase 2A protein]-leucine-carboxy methyltransferase